MKSVLEHWITILKNNSTIEVDLVNEKVFVEAFTKDRRIFLPLSDIYADWNIELWSCECRISNQVINLAVQNWIWEYIQQEQQNNTFQPFTTSDYQHQQNIIFS